MQCSMRRPDQAPRSSFPIFHIYLSKLEHKAKYYLQYISKYFIFISTPPPFCTSAVSAPPPGCPMIVAWRRTPAGNCRCYKYNNGHVSRVLCPVSYPCQVSAGDQASFLDMTMILVRWGTYWKYSSSSTSVPSSSSTAYTSSSSP